jgi:hypothetical protein
MPGMEYVHESRKSHQSNKQNTSPIEGDRCDLVGIGEKRPDEAPNRVDKGNDVDGQTSSAETPPTIWQWELKKTTVSDAA